MTKEHVSAVNTVQKTVRAISYRDINIQELGYRFLAFMLDVSVMLCPMAIWNIFVLAIAGSIIRISSLQIINMVTMVLLVISVFGCNSYILTQTKGQTLGMSLFGFRVIANTGKSAAAKQLLLRELVGFAVPFAVLMYFTGIFGVVVYWLVNGLVVVIDKKHRSMIDFIAQTQMMKVTVSKVKETLKTAAETEKTNMPMNSIDLHVHSTFSVNGEYNVEEIFQQAKKRHVHTISITDRNNVKTNAIALTMSELYGINYIPGIEMDCMLKDQRLRILGYFIDYNNELYSTIENKMLLSEKKASIARVRRFEKLLEHSIEIEDMINNNRFQHISGEMLARHVLNDPIYTGCEILKPYRKMDMKTAYETLTKDYFAKGAPCYVEASVPRLNDVLDVISLSNGIAVLAQPVELLQQPELLEEILDMGVQGLEVFHPSHSQKEIKQLFEIAKQRHLFVTCGSDFYRSKDGNCIGGCNCPKKAESIVDLMIDSRR